MNIIAIAERAKMETGIPRVHCLAVVKVVLESFASSIAANKDFKLCGVGSFTFQPKNDGSTLVIFRRPKQLTTEERLKKDEKNAKIRAAKNSKRELEWATRTWYSAIPDPVNISRYLAVPLLSRQALSMDSLLGDNKIKIWYGYKCHKGEKQVFNIIGAKKCTIATVVLTKELGLWEFDCVYPKGQGQNKSVHKAAILLVQKYNVAVQSAG